MAPTISNFTVTAAGKVTLNNPGVQTNPFLTWTTRAGQPVAASYALQSPTVTTYQMPVGFKAGDEAQGQRVMVASRGVQAAGSVFTSTVPSAPPPPPPPTNVTLPTIEQEG